MTRASGIGARRCFETGGGWREAGTEPVFSPFARIGLLVTANVDRIREAYKNAGVEEEV